VSVIGRMYSETSPVLNNVNHGFWAVRFLVFFLPFLVYCLYSLWWFCNGEDSGLCDFEGDSGEEDND
jgi:hypothetical protein